MAKGKRHDCCSASLLDGYVDEPASLGVPPYISPQARYIYGALSEAGCDVRYTTIDRARRGDPIPDADILVALMGAVVPGKYLRGMPMSAAEASAIAARFRGLRVIGGAGAAHSDDSRISDAFDHIVRKDLDAFAHDLAKTGKGKDRRRTADEWRSWSIAGAEVVPQHPDFPEPLIAEIDTSRGCVRYFTGGCSFCIEPAHGEPYFRTPEDVADEVRALHRVGVRNFRLGGQACIYSYMARGVGRTEAPTPNPEALEALLSEVRRAAPNLNVLHLDNANPAVIAEHPEEAEEATRSIVRHCTSGNAVAFGLESADPAVIEANNLNSTPEQALDAIRLLNRIGGETGESGLPGLLPGLNFVAGLVGERRETFRLNLAFLRKVAGEGLLVRRINIRQVAPTARAFPQSRFYGEFRRFKEAVRREIDAPMLERVAPKGRTLRRVFVEMSIGGAAFGRQVGSYPLLVSFPYKAAMNRYVDALVIGHGPRSVGAVETPLDVNSAPLSALEALPGIGRKRALRISSGRPYRSFKDFAARIDDMNVAASLERHVSFGP